MTSSVAPLKDLVVLDLTQYLAGPFATQVLGDLGATVVKIEPLVGDLSRHVSPYTEFGESTYYLAVNRNKHAISLDLKNPEAVRLVHDIARRADIVIENFRPGVADRLGVGWDALRALKPDLIYCSVSGFGQDGPARDLPAFDMVAQALSGVMSLNGHPGGPSARVGVPIGDIVAGMYAAIGVLAAVERRRSTGEGSRVDVAMLDSQVSLLSYLASAYLFNGKVPGLQGRGHQAVPTYRSFVCRGGDEVVITANTEKMWLDLCEQLELSALAEDPRFATADLRLEHRAILEPLLEEGFARWSSDEVIERLEGRVPVARINNVAEALRHEQVVHRSMVVEMEGPDGETARVVGNPVKFVDIELPERMAPRANADADWIVEHIARWSEQQKAVLVQAGAVGLPTQGEQK